MSGRAFAFTLFDTGADACTLRDRIAIASDYATMVSGMAAGWSAGLPISE